MVTTFFSQSAGNYTTTSTFSSARDVFSFGKVLVFSVVVT